MAFGGTAFNNIVGLVNTIRTDCWIDAADSIMHIADVNVLLNNGINGMRATDGIAFLPENVKRKSYRNL
ncbi:MAG: hypothetical protein LBF01_01350 [Bacteroidales bacterium]|jgi:hypothetical protein|nr:hypothetical protein [Bacteroidales bacterium]